MRLAAALEPVAGALALKACVLDGAAHPSSLPFTVWLRGPPRDQTSTKDRGIRASLPSFAAAAYILRNQGFASCSRLRPFIQRALSRRKQGFESPRERQWYQYLSAN